MKRLLALLLALTILMSLASVSLAEGKTKLKALIITHPLTKSVTEMKWLQEIADDANVEIDGEEGARLG